MKKLCLSAIVVTMATLLAACGGGTPAADTPDPAPTQGQTPQPATSASESAALEIEFVSEEYQVYPDTFGDPTATYLAEFRNPSDTPIDLVNTSLDLEQPDGTLIKTVPLLTTSPRVIPAGGTGYICDEIYNSVPDGEISMETLSAAVVKLHYTIEPQAKSWVPSVELSQVSAKDEFGHVGMMGKIKNTSSETYNHLFVSAAVRDASGKLLTVVRGGVDDLAPGAEKGFEGVAFNGRPVEDLSTVTLDAFAYQ